MCTGFFCEGPWQLGLNTSADGTRGCILNLIYRSQPWSVKNREGGEGALSQGQEGEELADQVKKMAPMKLREET